MIFLSNKLFKNDLKLYKKNDLKISTKKKNALKYTNNKTKICKIKISYLVS